jgi:peroxiredoxin Q/BCP
VPRPNAGAMTADAPRRAGPADVPRVAELLAELCAGDRDEALRAARAAVEPGGPGHEAWVLPAGTAAAGFLALEPSSQPRFGVGFVEWIAVDPAHRRRGLGLRLLGLAAERARALGWRQLHACTFHTNRAALHLYVEAGFFPAATLHDYAGPGLHYVELVRPVPAAAYTGCGAGPDGSPPEGEGCPMATDAGAAPAAGKAAPDFTAPAAGGATFHLSDALARGPVVLYFYPKDDTPGCTAEACGFRDRVAEFAGAGAQVVGVSGDSVESHERFAAKYGLPFPLVSDEGGEIRRLYGVEPHGPLPRRATFVIDRGGVIREVLASLPSAPDHVVRSLGALA